MDLRCDAKLHAIVVDEDVVEVKCDSRFCGASKETAVLHRFNVKTGEMVQTLRFKNPEGRERATYHSSAAVRSA